MGHLYRIVYTSSCALEGSDESRVSGVATLLAAGRSHNGRSGLTSVLVLHRGRFAQVIEGSREAAEALFERIRRDRRHRDLRILAHSAVPERRFEGRPLALAGHSAEGRARLDALLEGAGADLARLEPLAFLQTLDAILAAEDRGGREPPAAPRTDPGEAERQAVDAVLATAVLLPDRRILRANANFHALLAAAPGSLPGLDHGALMVGEERARLDTVWAAMAEGRTVTLDHRGLRRDGAPRALRSTFRPRRDGAGALLDVVVICAESAGAPEAGPRQADCERQIAALHRSHAVVTFDMGGIVLDANARFLSAFGYAVQDVVGRHHRMFVDPAQAHGADYARFWGELAQGRHQAGQFKRLGHDGREIWLQATYDPVLDAAGRPVKVIALATIVTDEKLLEAEHQGQIAAIHKAQCVIAFDLDGTVLDANDNFLAATGYRLGEVRGRHHRMFVDGAEAATPAYAAFWADLARGSFRKGEFRRVGRDGREVWLQATYNPIYDMEGRPFRIIKYAVDVTAAMRERADLEGQIAAIRKSQGLITFAMDGTVAEANAKALDMLGYEAGDLVGRHHSLLVETGHAASEAYRAFWATLRSGTFLSGLYRRRARDGRTVWVQATYNPILDPAGRPFKVVEIGADVSHEMALAAAYEDARRQAQHDPATALPNRTRLTSFMAMTLGPPASRLAVLYLGLDGFGAVVDAVGQESGDWVLGEVADRLRRALGPDQMAARVGGDEFVVAAPDLAEHEIDALCRRLAEALSAPIPHHGRRLSVGLSIGVAVAPSDGTTPDQLLGCADAALRRSRQAGGGASRFYAAATQDRILAHRALADDMARGLAAEEFFLEFQPRFEPRTRRLRGAEALVRWNHPERGRIAPGDFIALAERSGLIVPLGEWVLRAACRAAADWSGLGVSVNVSPVQFRTGNLVALVEAALADSGLDANRLEIEITEGVLLEDAERARTALDALKALGVRISMDDFGTGYSSLSSLRSFPFDVIKIDRTFVADMDGRAGGRAVVQAILRLGQALGLSVTAEGVETTAQLAMLSADGCQEVQGFLLGRPMAAALIAAWPWPGAEAGGPEPGRRDIDAA